MINGDRTDSGVEHPRLSRKLVGERIAVTAFLATSTPRHRDGLKGTMRVA